jgi:hypothetical protein
MNTYDGDTQTWSTPRLLSDALTESIIVAAIERNHAPGFVMPRILRASAPPWWMFRLWWPSA